MAADARKNHVREGEKGVYHVWSRCVQRIWLFGVDPVTKQDFSHRKEWLIQLLMLLVKVFAIDVGAFHFLSNHIHLILCLRPDIAARWTREEIAWRWKMAWSKWDPAQGTWVREVTDDEIDDVLAKGPEHIEKLRRCLMSLSWLMHRLKEPVAKLANQEMGTSGHMWAERFGCRELEYGEELSGLVYTDLQQMKCGAVDRLVDSEFSSIKARIETYAHLEAQHSLEDFQSRKGAEHYQLDEEVVKQLIIDSCLTPFSDSSPFLSPYMGDEEEKKLVLPEENRELILPQWYREESAAEEGQLESTGEAALSEDEAGSDEQISSQEAVDGGGRGNTESDESDVETTIDHVKQGLQGLHSDRTAEPAGSSTRGASSGPSRQFDRSLEEPHGRSRRGSVTGSETYRRHRRFLPRLEERLKQSRPFVEITREDYIALVQRAAAEWNTSERSRDPIHSETQAPRMGDDGSLRKWRDSYIQFGIFFTEVAKKFFARPLNRGDPPDEPPSSASPSD